MWLEWHIHWYTNWQQIPWQASHRVWMTISHANYATSPLGMGQTSPPKIAGFSSPFDGQFAVRRCAKEKYDPWETSVTFAPFPEGWNLEEHWAKAGSIIYLVVHPTNRKWVITLVINGRSGASPLITRLITHLLSGMNHQVGLLHSDGLPWSQRLPLLDDAWSCMARSAFW